MTYQQARDESALNHSLKSYGMPDLEDTFSKGADWARRHTLMSDEMRGLANKVQALLNQFAIEKKAVEACSGRHVQLDYGLMVELNDAVANYEKIMKEIR